MIVVSFYTNDTYKAHAQRLVRSLDKHGLKHEVEFVHANGNAIHQKPLYIRRKLAQHPGEDIVWIDADAVVRRRPELLMNMDGNDLAAFSMRYMGDVWGGTLLFSHSEMAGRVLESWIQRCKERPDRLDQINLKFAIHLDNPGARILHLPAEYCWIDRVMRESAPQAQSIIEHLAPSFPNAPATLDEDDVVCRNLVSGCHGLGDTIYMRPALRRLAKMNGPVHVATAWPQFVEDIPGVLVVRPKNLPLRAQARNVATWAGQWTPMPDKWTGKTLAYTPTDLATRQSIPQILLRRAGMTRRPAPEELRLDVRSDWVKQWMLDLPRPLGVVHPPTIRREWRNSSRNPAKGLIQAAIDAAPWINWVSVAWLEDGEEELDGPPLERVFARFEKGQLQPVELVAGLLSIADVALTSPCFMLPLAAAVGTPTFTVFGGCVPPPSLVDPAMRGVTHVAPDPFCGCLQPEHNCVKTIAPARVAETFRVFASQSVGSRRAPASEAREKISILLPSGIGDCHWVLVKLGAWLKQLGKRAELWVLDFEKRPRALDFLQRVPFVDAKGYVPGLGNEIGFSKAYHTGDLDIVPGFKGFDYFVCFNGSLAGAGRDLEKEILPECEADWDYPIVEMPEDVEFQRQFAAQHGRYILLFFSEFEGFGRWSIDMTEVRIRSLVSRLKDRFPGRTIVLTGAAWDTQLNKRLADCAVDMAGRTPLGPFLSLVRRADGFLGYIGGNTILSAHFGTPTVAIWSRRAYRTPAFRWNWCRPASRGRTYRWAEIEDYDVDAWVELLAAAMKDGGHL